MTNPPFGKKCVIDDKKILEHYHLGHKWEKGEDGTWIETKKVDESRTDWSMCVNIFLIMLILSLL